VVSLRGVLSEQNNSAWSDVRTNSCRIASSCSFCKELRKLEALLPDYSNGNGILSQVSDRMQTLHTLDD
jgi:hypothetical protein